MIRTRVAVGAVAALTAAGLAVPAVADKPGDTDTTKTSYAENARECDNGTVTLAGPQTLWPPNHKMVDQTATATADESDEQVSLQLLISLLDAVGGDGSPQQGADMTYDPAPRTGTGTVEVPLAVRAERSGKGTGRTYTIDWQATFGDETCASPAFGGEQAPFEIFVPHDQGRGKATGRQ